MRSPRVSARARHARAKREGIATLGGYDTQLRTQDGRCAICGRPPKVRRLNIDHDHHTGRVRGLLCHKCNRMLAWSADSPSILQIAATYLSRGWRSACALRDKRG